MAGVILTNRWLAGYLNENTTNLGAWIIHKKWKMLGEQTEPVDYLVLGDSTCNQGLNNGVLNQELGGSSLNLCTTGSAALVGEAWMLEEYVERVGPPKHVIIGHAYDVWPRRLNRGTWANVPRPTLAIRQDIVDYDDEQLLEALLLQNVPLYSQDVTLKNLLLGPLRRRLADVSERPRPEVSFQVDPFGFYAESGPHFRALRRDLRAWERRRHRAFISSDNKKAIAEVARLASDHQFQVTYVNGPFYEQAYGKPKVVQSLAHVATRTIEKHASLRYCENHFLYAGHQLRNVDHATVEASVDYTKKVAALIRDPQQCL